jgi:hypothetical protein
LISEACTSDIFSVVSEDINAEEQHGKLVLRVADEKLWIRLLQDLLRAANVGEHFGLEAHKVFHLDQSAEVCYTWILVLWGDPVPLLPTLAPILGRKAVSSAKPPPFALGRPPSAPRHTPAVAKTAAAVRTAPQQPRSPQGSDDEDAPLPEVRLALREGVHNIRKVERVNNGVTNMRTTVRLAHIRGERFAGNSDPHETITLSTGSGRFKAVVQPLQSEDGFQARRTGGGSL